MRHSPSAPPATPLHLAQAALDGLPAHICVLDAQGTILSVNRAWREFARQNGGDPQRVAEGSNYLGVCVKAGPEVVDAGRFEQGLRDVLAGRAEQFEYEYPCHSPREERWFVVSASRVQGSEPARAVVAHHSVTARKRAEQQQRDQQKMESLGTLAGGIAHDFNNILSAILGNTAMALDDLKAHSVAEPVRTQLEQVHRAGLRARELVRQILAFGRSEPHAVAVRPVRPMVEEALALLRATLPAQVRLHTHLLTQPLWLRVGSTDIEQLLINLCTNAWHALQGQPGSVRVGMSRVSQPRGPAGEAQGPAMATGPCLHLWVADTGCGMDAATRARIFEPFFTTKTAGQGTGLGLAVVHGIVARQGGSVVVESAPGQGSCFHIYLPLALGQAPTPEGTPAGKRVPVRGQGQHVLLLDDDEVAGITAEALLKRAGYRVTRFTTPKQALQALQRLRHDFDVLVSDYSMPELSGLDMARRVAAMKRPLPVLIISGHITDEMRTVARRLGVKALLHKENAFEELAASVQRVLAQRAH
jgi:signal transduction histidine kinase/CheY-like chemotaxis protein